MSYDDRETLIQDASYTYTATVRVSASDPLTLAWYTVLCAGKMWVWTKPTDVRKRAKESAAGAKRIPTSTRLSMIGCDSGSASVTDVTREKIAPIGLARRPGTQPATSGFGIGRKIRATVSTVESDRIASIGRMLITSTGGFWRIGFASAPRAISTTTTRTDFASQGVSQGSNA